MLDVQWICRDDAVNPSGTPDSAGVGWAAAEDISSPVEKAVAIFEEFRYASE